MANKSGVETTLSDNRTTLNNKRPQTAILAHSSVQCHGDFNNNDFASLWSALFAGHGWYRSKRLPHWRSFSDGNCPIFDKCLDSVNKYKRLIYLNHAEKLSLNKTKIGQSIVAIGH